jgi:ketosteroid isomerase-like protein
LLPQFLYLILEQAVRGHFMTIKSVVLCLISATFLGALLVAGSGQAAGQKLRETDRAAIMAVLTAQQTEWNKGDIRGFMAGYWNSSELTFAESRGFTRGWEPVMARYEKNYADKAAMGTLNFQELELRSLGADAALVLGKWHLQRQAGDIGGIFTLVFERFPEGWRIVHDHTTQSPATK